VVLNAGVWRLQVEGRPPLLTGCSIVLMGESQRVGITKLVQLAGGQVLGAVPPTHSTAAAASSCRGWVVCLEGTNAEEVQVAATAWRMEAVLLNWVLDCISAGRLLDTSAYLFFPLNLE
jgi:hypothetical protein